MSRQDQVTGKKSLKGNKRSHAMNATRRHFGLNLQKITIVEKGKKKVLKVTAKTARTLRKSGQIT